MSFINKVILVTGASSDIGEAISLHFAKFSARLSLVDKTADQLKKIADVCEQISRVKVLSTVVDLSKDDHVKRAVDDTLKEFGRIDVVINCGEVYKPGNILDPNLIEVFDDVVDANLRSVVSLTNRVASILAESKGCIVNVSSATSTQEASQSIPYNTAHAGLDLFTKSVALDLAPKGIRVNTIIPGIIDTRSKREATDESGVLKDEQVNTIAPLGRMVKVEDIAELAAFLSSDKARAMTGCSYRIDAGLALI